MPGKKSLIQLKHTERLSRQTRQYRTNLNRIQERNLHRHIDSLLDRYERTYLRLKAEEKLEKQRRQVLDLTIQTITNERQRPNTSNNEWSSPRRISCHLFSHDCQLYPCQPIYHYQSFLGSEHDQTLRQRKLSNDDFQPISNTSYLQNIVADLQEKNYEQNRRHLTATIQNQSHLANRYAHMQRAMKHLNEQSHLLHQRLAEKKPLGYIKEREYELKQAIQRHLTISAKFCG